MIEVEILDIHVARPCPVCHIMPRMQSTQHWNTVMCPSCGMGASVQNAEMNDAIKTYNRVVEAHELCENGR